MAFSTFDEDNDVWRGNCATDRGGGGNWWKECGRQNINGKYGNKGDSGAEFMFWLNFDGYNRFMPLKNMTLIFRQVV